jgi:hypothetical protein
VEQLLLVPVLLAASCGGASLTNIKQDIGQQAHLESPGPLRGPTDQIGFLAAVNGQASAKEGSVKSDGRLSTTRSTGRTSLSSGPGSHPREDRYCNM